MDAGSLVTSGLGRSADLVMMGMGSGASPAPPEEACPINVLGFGEDPLLITMGFACGPVLSPPVPDEACPINVLGYGDEPLTITMGYACGVEEIPVTPGPPADTCPVNVLGFGDNSLVITMGYACDATEIVSPPASTISNARLLQRRGGSGRRTPETRRPDVKPPLAQMTVRAALIDVDGEPISGLTGVRKILYDPASKASIRARLDSVKGSIAALKIKLKLKGPYLF